MTTPDAPARMASADRPRRRPGSARPGAVLVVVLVILAAVTNAPVQQRDAVATARAEARAATLLAFGATPADLCGGGGAPVSTCLVCTCCCGAAAALPALAPGPARTGWLLPGAPCRPCGQGAPVRHVPDPGTPLRGPPALA